MAMMIKYKILGIQAIFGVHNIQTQVPIEKSDSELIKSFEKLTYQDITNNPDRELTKSGVVISRKKLIETFDKKNKTKLDLLLSNPCDFFLVINYSEN
jgi:hypothetical protein